MAKAAPKKAPASHAAKSTAKKATKSAKAAPAKVAATRSVPAKAAKRAAPKKAAVKAAAVPKKAADTTRRAPTRKAAHAPAPSTDTAEAPSAPVAHNVSPYDEKFLDAQRKLLLDERAKLVGEAENLEAEAASLMEDLEPGDVQFDDESGEGDTLVVERERDLALSAQARQMVLDIDAALSRIEHKTYGLSLVSGRPIPKERLRAIPWATELVEEKVGGLGTRR